VQARNQKLMWGEKDQPREMKSSTIREWTLDVAGEKAAGKKKMGWEVIHRGAARVGQ